MRRAVHASVLRGRSCGHLRENTERENLFDDPQGFHIALDTEIRKLIRRETFLVETAEAGLVAEERAILDARAAREQFPDRAMQPDEHSTALTQQRDIVRLGGGAAAE